MVTGLFPVVGVTLPLFSYGSASAPSVMLTLGPVELAVLASVPISSPTYEAEPKAWPLCAPS
jgi:hypothetical protein